MTKRNKLIERFLQNPTHLTYTHIENILLHIGFEKIHAKGSHIKLKHPMLSHDIIIPIHRNDCKAFYKKQMLKILQDNNLI